MALGLLTNVLMGGNLAGMGMSFYPPLGPRWSRNAFRGDPTKGLPLGDLINLRVKDRIDDRDFHKWANEDGFDENFADLLRLAQSQYLTGMEYVNLWRRGHITEKAVDDHLKHLGLQELDVQLFKKVTEYFPLPGDLIRFAVREVYTPSIVSKFGLMADIPSKYLEEAKKAGLEKEQASNFWAAHWVLPGINQGYEMLQREEITREELEALFVAADIMPFWRDPLLNISYNPLARVDVRRMYRVGTIPAEDLPKHYRHAGFSPPNAELMADFTVKYESSESVGLTRAAVVGAYKKKVIEEVELREHLASLNMPDNVIQFWVDMAEWERAMEEITRDINELVNQYRLGMKTKAQVQNALNAADLPATVIKKTMDDMDAAPSLRVKLPSKGDLDTWIKLAVIDEEEYTNEMRDLGYQENHIVNYLTEITLQKEVPKRKYLPDKTYLRWLVRDIITVEVFEDTLKKKGVSEDDISRYLLEMEEQKGEREATTE